MKDMNIVLLIFLICFTLKFAECNLFIGKFKQGSERKKHNLDIYARRIQWQQDYLRKSSRLYGNETVNRVNQSSGTKARRLYTGWTIVLLVLLGTFVLYCGGWQIHKRCFKNENDGLPTQDCI